MPGYFCGYGIQAYGRNVRMYDPKKMTRREAPVERWLDMAYAETVLSMIRKHLLLYGLLLLPAAGIG